MRRALQARKRESQTPLTRGETRLNLLPRAHRKGRSSERSGPSC